MAFCLSTRDIYWIRDYAHAVETYHQLKPWRGETEVGMWRCLDQRNTRKRHVAIRLNEHTGDVVCRLHSTDVVTYHPNDEITIQPYESVSTDKFAQALLPGGFMSMMNRNTPCMGVEIERPPETEDGPLWGSRYRFYQLRDKDGKRGLRFRKVDGYWTPTQEPMPFDKYVIDRKRSREVLAQSNYKDFAAFTRGVHAVGGGKLDTTGAAYGFAPAALIEALADQSRWMDIIKAYHRRWGSWRGPEIVWTVSGLLERVRLALYTGTGVVVVEKTPYVDGYYAVKAIDAAERKYRYL